VNQRAILRTLFSAVLLALTASSLAHAGATFTLATNRGGADASSNSSAAGGSGGFQVGHSSSSHLGTFDIVFSADAALNANPAALEALNRAAAQWESRIADPITVNINASLAALGPGVLGNTGSVNLVGGYNDIRDAVVIDALDEPDDVVATQVPTAANAMFRLPNAFATDGTLQATKANLKALGFVGLDDVFGAADGQLTFSTNFPFDFDRSNGITPGQYDFESIAAHEIGHALDFLSDVEFVDAVLSLAPQDRGTLPQSVEPTTLDLFRFDEGGAEDPATLVDFATFPRSMIPGNAENFDQITGALGGSPEVPMATGLTQGDGRQASHWKDNLGLGIMDPTLFAGEIGAISANDLRSLDLIGYEIIAIPEAGAALLLTAVGLVSGLSLSVARRS
jgi:hypothetical protein